MKVKDFEKAVELLNDYKKLKNHIQCQKDYLEYKRDNRLWVSGVNAYFNAFNLTEEETKMVIQRQENQLQMLGLKLKELGVEMD